ncbi:hypothetical protein [Primorskyibacter marinus]|uniref:hypothetical protein n=1 Tax=Primorskyibacter marinus TaxID=1977320 RepID=UPI000E30ADE4|nr:hypothetical protein [Primorskyibacter marinus]
MQRDASLIAALGLARCLDHEFPSYCPASQTEIPLAARYGIALERDGGMLIGSPVAKDNG